MPSILPAADIVICRCGAMTLSEITLLGIPAVLSPSPNVTGNHQYKNGRRLSDAGAALLIEERELSGEFLTDRLQTLISDSERRRMMSEHMRQLGTPTATEMCIRSIEEIVSARH